jgi:hypothetical protein
MARALADSCTRGDAAGVVPSVSPGGASSAMVRRARSVSGICASSTVMAAARLVRRQRSSGSAGAMAAMTRCASSLSLCWPSLVRTRPRAASRASTSTVPFGSVSEGMARVTVRASPSSEASTVATRSVVGVKMREMNRCHRPTVRASSFAVHRQRQHNHASGLPSAWRTAQGRCHKDARAVPPAWGAASSTFAPPLAGEGTQDIRPSTVAQGATGSALSRPSGMPQMAVQWWARSPNARERGAGAARPPSLRGGCGRVAAQKRRCTLALGCRRRARPLHGAAALAA